MDMEDHVEEEEEVVGLLRRQQGGTGFPRKGPEEEGLVEVVGAGAGEDDRSEINDSPPGMKGLVLDVEEEEVERREEWVGAAVKGVGEGGHSEKRDEVGGVVAVEDDELIMQGALEETDFWDILGVRGFSEKNEQQKEEVQTFQQTDTIAVEEYTLDTTDKLEKLDERPGHGRSVGSLKDHPHIEHRDEVEVISGFLNSNVEGVTDHKYSDGVIGMGAEALILEEAEQEKFEEEYTEETEYDVENVLEKQNTHDLFCPNCKSCITRRVVLCRKRRKVRNLGNRLKDARVKRVPISASNSEPVITAEDRNIPETVTNVNEDQIYAANEETDARDVEVEEREVFRCLSCLGFFIRTGDGPKPFWSFGGKKLGGNVQGPPEELPPTKTNTFLSIFRKTKVTAKPDETAAEEPQNETRRKSDSLIANQAIAHQNQNGVSFAVTGTSTETNTVVSIGLTAESTKHIENSVRDSDKKVAESLQNGVPVATKGDPPEADSLIGVGLSKDTSKLPEEIQRGDTLSKDAVEESAIIYQENSLLSEPVVEKTTIEIKQTMHGKVIKREPSKVIQPSSTASLVLGQTDIEIHHTTVTETGKQLPALKGLSTLPEGVTPLPQSSLSEASAAIVNSSSAPGKQLIKDIDDLTLPLVKALQDATKKKIDDVIVDVEDSPVAEAALQTGVQTSPAATPVTETGQACELDIIKSIVYGGLIESITSLGIVSSAAGGGASTLNTLALALANLFGGLLLIAHNLRELENQQPSTTAAGETQDRYTELLGNRRHIFLHASIVILSFIVFGAVAPVTYAFSFRKSNSRDYKLAAVAGVSLFCILLLAVGKAYVRNPPKTYLKTISYYLSMGFMASGISFLVGVLFDYLLQKLGWFSSTSSVSGPWLVSVPTQYGTASY
ncbi:hypothetical protein MLD38_009049 [Melastoma candidum]|uniref:Uncharacterized protein n=1 Tax=Melastoma candidum TaxID=119954 RepID=A0ACB9RZZ8_9MYRT|nr:hypothetical protein MLD38_009049 [Melastoma candidum]